MHRRGDVIDKLSEASRGMLTKWQFGLKEQICRTMSYNSRTIRGLKNSVASFVGFPYNTPQFKEKFVCQAVWRNIVS
jgi:hypothetical protein